MSAQGIASTPSATVEPPFRIRDGRFIETTVDRQLTACLPQCQVCRILSETAITAGRDRRSTQKPGRQCRSWTIRRGRLFAAARRCFANLVCGETGHLHRKRDLAIALDDWHDALAPAAAD